VCPDCDTPISTNLVYNTVLLKIRQHLRDYYGQPAPASTHPDPDGGDPHPYPEARLRHQLTYYASLFDYHNAKDQVWRQLDARVFTPLKKEKPALAEQNLRRLRDVHAGVVEKTIPEELHQDPSTKEAKDPGRCRLRGDERQAAEDLIEFLNTTNRMINLRRQLFRRHFVDPADLFGDLGLDPVPV